jgi:hypothetical protein
MKAPTISFVFLIACAFVYSSAWSWERKRAYDYRPEQFDQFKNRQQQLKYTNSSSRSSHEIVKSDVGLQRPIESKMKGFGYQLGFSSKIYHTNNTISTKSGPDKFPAGIWENTLINNFLLGAYDLRGATFSPVVGLSYTNFNHFGHDKLKDLPLDFGSLHLNFAGIFTFGKGWSLRPSLGYTADLSLEDSMSRQYSQVSPGIALGKSFSIGTAQSFLEWSMNYTFTNTPDQRSKDLMDRFETGLAWGIDIPFGDFEFSPFINLALADYSNHPYESRTDFRGTLGLNLTYSITDWMALRIYSTLSSRNSSEDIHEFNRIDTGGGATLNARF